MKEIGGNITAVFQTKGSFKDEFGEDILTWVTVFSKIGFLDTLSASNSYRSYDSKTRESSHVFIMDYDRLEGITEQNSRLLIDGRPYEVTQIDNPMNLNRHIEIYLHYVGEA